MRKKIILGIVILIVLAAAVGGAVYFDKNYAIVEDEYGAIVVRTDTARILRENFDDWDKLMKCTPSLKKLTKLEKLHLIAEEDMDLNYLSEMKNLNELTIFYLDIRNECKVKFETLTDLPNLKTLWLFDTKIVGYQTHFTLPDNVEYNFDSIETLWIDGNQYFDIDCLKHFKNLKNLNIGTRNLKLTEEQIEELRKNGINVEFHVQ